MRQQRHNQRQQPHKTQVGPSSSSSSEQLEADKFNNNTLAAASLKPQPASQHSSQPQSKWSSNALAPLQSKSSANLLSQAAPSELQELECWQQQQQHQQQQQQRAPLLNHASSHQQLQMSTAGHFTPVHQQLHASSANQLAGPGNQLSGATTNPNGSPKQRAEQATRNKQQSNAIFHSKSASSLIQPGATSISIHQQQQRVSNQQPVDRSDSASLPSSTSTSESMFKRRLR